MIILSVLSKESRAGKRKAAGRMVEEDVFFAVDPLNLILGKRVGGTIIGNACSFYGKMSHLGAGISKLELDEEVCRKLINESFAMIFGVPIRDLSWAEMDLEFKVPSRHSGGVHRGEYLNLYTHCGQFFGVNNESETDSETTEVEIEKEEVVDVDPSLTA